MAMTLEQICALLDQLEYNYKVLKEGDISLIKMVFDTKNFIDPDTQKKGLYLAIFLEENGSYFKLIAPGIFVVKDDTIKESFFKALLMVCNETKLIEFEYSQNSKRVRCVIEFPLEDNILTCKQLDRCITGITDLLDIYYPSLEAAKTGGIIDLTYADNFVIDRLVRPAEIEPKNDSEEDFAARLLGYLEDNLSSKTSDLSQDIGLEE